MYVHQIHIKPHEVFKWVDDDIHVDVPLSIKQVGTEKALVLSPVFLLLSMNVENDLLVLSSVSVCLSLPLRISDSFSLHVHLQVFASHSERLRAPPVFTRL